MNGKIKEDSEYSYTTLSSAGSPSNLYIGVNHGKNVRFMTNNIYGDREIVCEVSNLDQESGSITIEDPFIYPSAGSIPKLPISKILYQDLSARKVALRSTAALKVDTLSTSFVTGRIFSWRVCPSGATILTTTRGSLLSGKSWWRSSPCSASTGRARANTACVSW